MRVQWFHEVTQNNYCIFSGDGFPSLLDNHLRNSIEDVNSSGLFNYLVVCLDSDDDTIDERKKQVEDFIIDNNIKINLNTELVIIIQNKCFETWFLGNKKIYKKNPINDFLIECTKFYNVKINDPEQMGKPLGFEQSTSTFHSAYLQEILAERKIRYSKKNPQGVVEKYFLDELIKRNKKTNHIQTFKYFIDFCNMISEEFAKSNKVN